MSKPSTHEPVTQLRRVPIVECGEPLTNYLELSDRIKIGASRWVYQRESIIRESVAHMLAAAAESLPSGYTLAVTEGWRPPHIQKRMYMAALERWREKRPEFSEIAIRRIANRFTAPPHAKVPPPHTTGGAVDAWLGDVDGKTLNHIAPYEVGDSRSYPVTAKRLSTEAIAHRRILVEALSATGLTNYPSEYWHWSYGDQGWAYRGGHLNAIYGPVTPPDYAPPDGDDVDAPLIWLG